MRQVTSTPRPRREESPDPTRGVDAARFDADTRHPKSRLSALSRICSGRNRPQRIQACISAAKMTSPEALMYSAGSTSYTASSAANARRTIAGGMGVAAARLRQRSLRARPARFGCREEASQTQWRRGGVAMAASRRRRNGGVVVASRERGLEAALCPKENGPKRHKLSPAAVPALRRSTRCSNATLHHECGTAAASEPHWFVG